VYDRKYDEHVLSFEASGGLLNASLVMRDRETDSWWSIMTGDAIGGELDGTRLTELPEGEKARWKDWRARHPHTKVLSIDGVEHVDKDYYANYFTSDGGFRGMTSTDTRLSDKEPIFSFQLDGEPYAVRHDVIEGGKSFVIGKDTEVFFYREPGVEMFASTVALIGTIESGKRRFKHKDGQWVDERTGTEITQTEQSADKDAGLELLSGFDTFWYIWATTHDNVSILD